MRQHKLWLALAALLLLALVGSAAGSGYTLYATFDGGGGFSQSNSGYTLRGTTGQPDHITLSGGSYALYAGFWRPDNSGDVIIVPTAVNVVRSTAQTPAAWLALLALVASGATLLWLRRKRGLAAGA